ncbi:hypothetical protein SAMN06265222_116131 [Neorhodopirellula lusitana]|uniref:Secreted protein n=1 Tax=Neorhodopirellula lusitana TaxID=445327 RepID=A0ABY1QJQ6_9BACT|nr:hypothetical protein [Neorhodopirellula lusitana]SMP73461.1 hypothetical protein SAMN06265222_116131 [Neorhodopirellula lusitana]
MKCFFQLFLASVLMAPVLGAVGCSDSSPTMVSDGMSEAELDAEAEAQAAKYDQEYAEGQN